MKPTRHTEDEQQDQCLHLDHHTHCRNPSRGSLTQPHSLGSFQKRTLPFSKTKQPAQGPLAVQSWEQWVKVLAADSHDLSSILRSHTVGENQLHKLSDTCPVESVCLCS